MRTRRHPNFIVLMGVACWTGCAADASGGADARSVAADSEHLESAPTCTDSLDDVYAQPKNLPPYDSTRRGDVVRCARGRTIDVAEISTSLANRGFVGIDVQHAVRLYRIAYRTERFDHRPDVSSALVLLPADGRSSKLDHDAPCQTEDARPVHLRGADWDRFHWHPHRRAPKPEIVFGHGTTPYGTACAYSRSDPAGDSLDRELGALLAFATQGFVVIMPDYAGFVTGSPVTGYLFSEDEAHALLDATRAMHHLLRDAPDRIAFVGHSQGGHAALSAQALAGSYGLSGELVGVATFAPFWAVGRTFGAIVSREIGYTTADQPGQLSFAIEYFYTHAQLYDGEGQGAQLFVPSVRADLQQFVSTCEFNADPSVLGETSADFFQPEFLDAVGPCGVFGGDACATGLAATWERRFRADRPALDPAGAPVVMWQGANDAVIPTALAKCAIDKSSAAAAQRNFAVYAVRQPGRRSREHSERRRGVGFAVDRRTSVGLGRAASLSR